MLGCRHDPERCADCRARVTFSRLKLLGLFSPAHYQAWTEKDTPAIERGRALHSIVLGGSRVLAFPGKVRRGKEYDSFVAANDGALILNGTDYALVAGMAEAVLRNREAMQVLRGEHEVEIDWTYLGRACQSHVDVVGPGGEYRTELKSSVTSQPERFAGQACRMAYPEQLAFYGDAIRAAGLGPARDAYVVVVEQQPPHVVTVMRATDRALDMGARRVRLWMERLLACEAANEWPGYVQGVVDLDAPAEDVELTFGGGDGPDFDPETGEVAA